ncbi:MAG: hypothetical protein O3A84_14095, partial [Proteobacteria bacterium]|nr:hypothetical protein [Pseudomonadota bacterium]
MLIFVKRMWLLSRFYGIEPPSSLLLAQFQSRGFRLLIGGATILATIGFAAMALATSGQMISVLTGGVVTVAAATWISGGFILLYLLMGGGRAASKLSGLQTGLALLAAISITAAILSLAGGWDAFFKALANLVTSTEAGATTSGRGGGVYDLNFAVAGAVQGIPPPLDTEAPLRPWTGLGIFAGLIALITITIGPMVTNSRLTTSSPPRIHLKALWLTGFLFGLVLIPFVTISGFAGSIFEVTPSLPAANGALGLLQHMTSGYLTELLLRIAKDFPLLAAVGAIGLVATLQAAIAYLLSGCVSLFAHQNNSSPSARGRMGITVLAVLTLAMAALDPDLATITASLGLAWSAQLAIPLVALCWLPWLTGRGIIVGLIAGLLVAFFTDVTGSLVLTLVFSVPWDAWPASIHPALWGLLANVIVCIFVSAASHNPEENRADQIRRNILRQFIDLQKSLRPGRRDLTIAAWAAALVWMTFAVGPGVVLGNDLFGAPNAGQSNWFFGLPSLLSWQIAMWGGGLALLWFIGR